MLCHCHRPGLPCYRVADPHPGQGCPSSFPLRSTLQILKPPRRRPPLGGTAQRGRGAWALAARGTGVTPRSECGLSGMWAWPTRAPLFVRMRPESLVMAAPERLLRKRNVGGAEHSPASPSSLARDPADSPARLHTGTFWLTRVVLLRALAFIYCECPVGAGCRRHPVTWSQALLASGLPLVPL